MSETIEGKLKWFDMGRGYGFIEVNNGGKDVFVHAKALKGSGIDLDDLVEGDDLTFTVEDNRGKTYAADIVKV